MKNELSSSCSSCQFEFEFQCFVLPVSSLFALPEQRGNTHNSLSSTRDTTPCFVVRFNRSRASARAASRRTRRARAASPTCARCTLRGLTSRRKHPRRAIAPIRNSPLLPRGGVGPVRASCDAPRRVLRRLVPSARRRASDAPPLARVGRVGRSLLPRRRAGRGKSLGFPSSYQKHPRQCIWGGHVKWRTALRTDDQERALTLNASRRPDHPTVRVRHGCRHDQHPEQRRHHPGAEDADRGHPVSFFGALGRVGKMGQKGRYFSHDAVAS